MLQEAVNNRIGTIVIDLDDVEQSHGRGYREARGRRVERGAGAERSVLLVWCALNTRRSEDRVRWAAGVLVVNTKTCFESLMQRKGRQEMKMSMPRWSDEGG